MASENAEDRVCIGLAERDVEDRSAFVHLSEQAAPRRLRPAGIGNGPVQITRAQVVPEARCSDVPQGVGLLVLHHLRVGDRAAREVQEQWIVAMRRVDRRRTISNRAATLLEREPATRRPSHAQPGAEFRHGRIDLRGARLVSDRRRRAGLTQAVRDVLRSEQIRARHRYRTDPYRAKQRRVPLRNPRQHHKHVVAPADAEIQQRPRNLARGARQVSRGLLRGNVPYRVDGQHRERVGVLRGPDVDDVQHGVEPLRDADAVATALRIEIHQPWGTIPGRTSKRENRHQITSVDTYEGRLVESRAHHNDAHSI